MIIKDRNGSTYPLIILDYDFAVQCVKARILLPEQGIAQAARV